MFGDWNGLSQRSGAALKNYVAAILPPLVIENSGNHQCLHTLVLVTAAIVCLSDVLFTLHILVSSMLIHYCVLNNSTQTPPLYVVLINDSMGKKNWESEPAYPWRRLID